MRKKNPVPTYRHFKPRDLAYVEIREGGKLRRVYLGKYDSAESKEEYRRILAELGAVEAGAIPIAPITGRPAVVTINELLLAFLRHAESYYVDMKVAPDQDGRRPPGDSLYSFRAAVRRLKEFCGNQPVESFTPTAFKTLRQDMIDREDLSRSHINDQAARMRGIFKWGVENELVPETTWRALMAVAPLKAGRTNARETAKRESVAAEHVEAVLAYLSPTVAAMVELQRVTGMRPDEVCRLRVGDLDMSGPVWLYEVAQHKTAHHGKRRVVPLGPKAQAVLRPFLTADRERYLFCPKDAMAWRSDVLRAKRKTRVQPSQQNRRKKNPRRTAGNRYTPDSYRRAVQRAIEQANRQIELANAGEPPSKQRPLIPMWFPYQLRHAHSDNVRRRFGEEAAQVSLGHARMDTTAIYGERNLKLAIDVAREIG